MNNWGLRYRNKDNIFYPYCSFRVYFSFFLVRHYTKNNLIAFIVALFYWFNTYFLVRQTAHLPIAFIFSLFPILILFFDKFLSNPNRRDFFFFTFLYAIMIWYEIRIMYICTIILIIYFFFIWIQNLKNPKFWKYILIFLLLQIWLNSYWLLPTIFSWWEAISSVANRGLFGNHLFNILYSLVGMDQSWTGWLPNQDFVVQQIPLYFWFYPTMIVLAAFFIWKYNLQSRRLIYFWFTISILWILLTKQSAAPITWFYQWLYENFPGFNLFREASKFFILIAVGYSIILWVFFDFLYKNSRRIFYIFWCISLTISWIISIPLVTQEIWTIFVPKIEPQEYKILNQYIQNQDENFKTLWIPQGSQWGSFDMRKPKVSLRSISDDAYKDFNTILPEKRDYGDYSSFIMDWLSSTILDISSIKYIIIPLLDPNDNFYRLYGSSPDIYYQKFKELWIWTELYLDWLNEVKVFENKSYLSTMFFSSEIIQKNNISNISYKDIEYIQKNPSHYTMNISLGDFVRNINFSQNNHSKWDLIVGDFHWYDYIGGDIFIVRDKVKTLDFLNSWSLKKDVILDEIDNTYWDQLKNEWYPKILSNGKIDYKYYILNTDGSIDMRVTLFFRSQAYFYVWLIISWFTLLGYIVYFLVSSFFSRRRIHSN